MPAPGKPVKPAARKWWDKDAPPQAPARPQQPKGGYAAPKRPDAQANTWGVTDGFDLSKAGAAEHAYGDNKAQLETAGAREQYAQPGQYQNAFDQSASGQYWNSLQGGAAPQADMSAYYDRAYDKGANRINTQMASRGMYNSSAATDGLGQFAADLGAQEAKDTAAYDQQERALYDQRMRGAATGADAAAQGRYTGELAGATGADQGLLGRLETLGRGASAADDARLNRTNTTFDNLAGFAGGVGSQVGGIYSDALDTDLGLFDTNQEMGLGSGLQNLNGTQAVGQGRVAGTAATAAGANADVQTGLAVGKAFYGMG